MEEPFMCLLSIVLNILRAFLMSKTDMAGARLPFGKLTVCERLESGG